MDTESYNKGPSIGERIYNFLCCKLVTPIERRNAVKDMVIENLKDKIIKKINRSSVGYIKAKFNPEIEEEFIGEIAEYFEKYGYRVEKKDKILHISWWHEDVDVYDIFQNRSCKYNCIRCCICWHDCDESSMESFIIHAHDKRSMDVRKDHEAIRHELFQKLGPAEYQLRINYPYFIIEQIKASYTKYNYSVLYDEATNTIKIN